MSKEADLNRTAIQATLHCLTGCAVGEVLGMYLGAIWNFSDIATIILAIALAFLFGYAFSLFSVLRNGLRFSHALKVVLAADTVSIATMELVDNLVIALTPGALSAHPDSLLFWFAMFVALLVAFIVTVPVNRYMIARGKGHAVIHEHHHSHHH